MTVQDHCVATDSKRYKWILSAPINVGFSHKTFVSLKQRSIKITTKLGFKQLLSGSSSPIQSLEQESFPCCSVQLRGTITSEFRVELHQY